MRIEENAILEGTQTEEIAAAKEERASAVLGKFKDIGALSSAYEALEAEFTRRSQKLRSLEKEVENLKAEAQLSGAEKLRKTARARREAAREFDAFVAEVDKGNFVDKPTEVLAQHTNVVSEKERAVGETPMQGDELAFVAEGQGEVTPQKVVGQEEGSTADNKKAAEGATALDDGSDTVSLDTLYKLALENEEVRLRIVGEYLSSLGRSVAPLTGGTAGVLTAPPKRAKTVGQAGAMALSYFQKPIVG